MIKANELGWYKELHKMIAIKIHTSCFDGAKRYQIDWGGCTGWYLNDVIGVKNEKNN
tara:strand:+ start:537 stop:707 length:171 start_codon:yes stop_codon:yes gene_type:complete